MAKLLHKIETLLQPLLCHNQTVFLFLSSLCVSNFWFDQVVWISTMKNDGKKIWQFVVGFFQLNQKAGICNYKCLKILTDLRQISCACPKIFLVDA